MPSFLLRTTHFFFLVFILTTMSATPASAGIIFSDNFDRPDSADIGNGWTEVDDPPLISSIAANALKMEIVSGTNKDTRIYRVGTQHNDIVLNGTLSISFSGPGGPRQVPRVVVRSNGTAGSGPGDELPCGIGGATPPNCWEGDGFGFHIVADKDASPNVEIQIVDDGLEMVKLTNFNFPVNTIHQWEMQINDQNHVALFIWTGAKPSVPTLEFTNGGNPYTPVASGDLWQIEVKNINLNDRSHTALWDDFQVMTTAECDPPLLVDVDNTGAFGAYEAVIKSLAIQGGRKIATFDIQGTVLDLPFLPDRTLRLWASIDDIVFNPDVVTVESDETDIVGATFADLRLVAPGTHTSFLASFCQPGTVTLRLGFNKTAILLTVADALVPLLTGLPVSALSPARILAFADALNAIPLYASAINHVAAAFDAALAGNIVVAFQEAGQAGQDLVRLALDREQRSQLLQAYINLGVNIARVLPI